MFHPSSGEGSNITLQEIVQATYVVYMFTIPYKCNPLTTMYFGQDPSRFEYLLNISLLHLLAILEGCGDWYPYI